MTHKFSRSTVTLWGLLSAATLVAMSATVVGFLGRLWWVFELASHFRAQYFLFLTASAFLFFLAGKSRTAILVTIFALVNLSLIVPFYFGSSWTHAGGRTFRAVSMNLDKSNHAHRRLQELIHAVEPDFIALFEVNRIWLHELQKLQAMYPFTRADAREDNFGVALLSRIPLEDAEIRHIGKVGVPSVVARFILDGQPLTVIGAHPVPPVGRVYSENRNQQLVEVAQMVRSQREDVMLLGDLNITSWSPFFDDLIRETGLRDSRKGFGLQPSWPTGFPLLWIPIDHCLVSSGVIVHDRHIGPNIGSDHYPVIVDFSVEGRVAAR